MTLRNWHLLSVSANATGTVLCLWALSVHPEWSRNLGMLVGWMLLNGAVSTKALRGKALNWCAAGLMAAILGGSWGGGYLLAWMMRSGVSPAWILGGLFLTAALVVGRVCR